MPKERQGMLLNPYRVLDLTDEGGLLCGRMLADMGADVVQVEPPGGSSARRIGPFYKEIPHPERSLFWWAYASNKRGITLNLATSDGRALLKRLAADAHFLIESFPSGHMKGLGLDYQALQAINPGLVMVSITPFGQDGPYAGYHASDLTGMAMGGFLYVTGDNDRPPVRTGFPQFYLLGAVGAAAGAMIAHTHRAATGEGQYVDVSCQQAVAKSLSQAPQSWDIEGVVIKRMGIYRMQRAGLYRRANWQCKDGYINFWLSGGASGAMSIRALLTWMDEEGMGDEELNQFPWEELQYGRGNPELTAKMDPPLDRFFIAHTKKELTDGAFQRRILLFPVNTPKEIVADPQLEARGYFQELSRDGVEEPVPHLGAFIQDREDSRVGLRRPAPKVGEHNREIYVGELGLSQDNLVTLREAGAV